MKIVGCFLLWSLALPACMAGASRAAAAEPATVADVLAAFSQSWPDDRVPYRTEEDTASWKAYAVAMQRLVALGDKATTGLIAACDSPSFQVRALSARVLGLLGAKAAVPKLATLLQDGNSAVAVLAADALGQIQDPAGLDALKKAQTQERRGDVLLHISKALGRGVPLENDVTAQILKLDSQSLGAAKVGQTAPDFTLKDPGGKPWTLSDFRGKKNVVLVFIYGDG